MSDVAHISYEQLLRYAEGGLTPKAAAQVDAHLAVCATCAQARGDLDDARAHFLTAVYPRTLEAVQQRVRPTSWARRLFPKGGRFALATVALLLVAVVAVRWVATPGAPEDVAVRGGRIRLQVVREGRAVELTPAFRLQAKDRLQLEVDVPPGCPFVTVLAEEGGVTRTVFSSPGPFVPGLQRVPAAWEWDGASPALRLTVRFSSHPNGPPCEEESTRLRR